MSFQEYLKREKSVLKYQELLEKFHGGKTLHERTSLENGLVQACEGALVKKLAGREFCFSMTNELECPYQKKILTIFTYVLKYIQLDIVIMNLFILMKKKIN